MKIQITQVNYGRTINMGNYESVRLDLTAKVNQGEDYKQVLEELKGEILKLEKRTKKEGFWRNEEPKTRRIRDCYHDYDYSLYEQA